MVVQSAAKRFRRGFIPRQLNLPALADNSLSLFDFIDLWARMCLKPYASEGAIGKYLYCKSVHPDGNYFSMEVTATNPDNSTFDAEISIPHRYVKFVIAAQDKRTIGFLSD